MPTILGRSKYPSGCLDTSAEGNLKYFLKIQGHNHSPYQHCKSLFSFCYYRTAYFVLYLKLILCDCKNVKKCRAHLHFCEHTIVSINA